MVSLGLWTSSIHRVGFEEGKYLGKYKVNHQEFSSDLQIMKKAALHSIVNAEVHFLPWGLAKEVAQNVSCF